MPVSPEAARASGEEIGRIADRVVTIVRSVMRQEDVHGDTNLLELGASSLTAVRIRTRIRTDLGRQVELLDLLENPTPRGIAAVIAVAPARNATEPWQQLDWTADPEEVENTPPS
jgi:aryl carrier-like protein